MDTRLKNIKYSNITKGIAVFLVWFFFMSAVFSTGFFLYNQEIMTTESYYETYGFVEKYSRLVHNVVEYNIKFTSKNGVIIFGNDPSTIAENSERYQIIKNRLTNTVNFAYFIKNSTTGEIISNVNAADRVALLKKQPTYIYVGQGEVDLNAYFNEKNSHITQIYYPDEISEIVTSTPYEVHAALIEPFRQGDAFYDEFSHYSQIKSIAPYIIALFIVSVVLMLAAFGYLVWAAGRREKDGEIVLTSVDKIYTDVHTILVFFAAIISVAIVTGVSYGDSNTIMFIAAGIVLSVDVFIGLSYLLSMARQIKNRQILKNSLIYKLFIMLRKYAVLAFRGKLFKAWILAVLLGYGGANGILFSVFFLSWRHSGGLEFALSGLLLLGFNIAATYFAAKSLRNLTQIMEAAKELSAGDIDYSIDTKEMSAAFAGFAEDLQGVQSGLKKAVAEAVKGERMKTELITNVSHDLKTPLTSIINYVDLLKQEELNNGNAKEYVMILEEKSARLKQLVEDLIEASKASSGSLSVSAEKVDLRQLVMQAYGEYEEKIEKAGLDIRISTADDNIEVNADGKHLWRIVENLLSNALKYSMHGSRVYINVDKNEQYGILIIKNISAYPLEISPEQLAERFVRGDASRTTEGSGLGLSIAQSLANLQGGSFKIEIDGDLFKVTVEIPLWKKE